MWLDAAGHSLRSNLKLKGSIHERLDQNHVNTWKAGLKQLDVDI